MYFVWLGANRAAKRGVDEMGTLLDKAAKASLPVPDGAILLHEFYELVREQEIIQEKNGRFTCPNPQHLVSALYSVGRLPAFAEKVMIQTAFNHQPHGQNDPFQKSNRVQNIDANVPNQLADALCSIWSIDQKANPTNRKDIIITRQVNGINSGLALTHPSFEDDRFLDFNRREINTLPKLAAFEPAESTRPPVAQRVQMMMRGIRRSLGASHWEVEWIDDGRICWLVKIRPLDDTNRPDETFIPFSPSEPLCPLLMSAATTAVDRILNIFQAIDGNFPYGRQLLKIDSSHNQLFINFSLLNDTFRKWGLSNQGLKSFTNQTLTPTVPRRLFRSIKSPSLFFSLYIRKPALQKRTKSLHSFRDLALWLEDTIANLLIKTLLFPAKGAGFSNLGSFQSELQTQILSKNTSLINQAVSNGQLPSINAIWSLTSLELSALDDDFSISSAEVRKRQQVLQDHPPIPQ